MTEPPTEADITAMRRRATQAWPTSEDVATALDWLADARKRAHEFELAAEIEHNARVVLQGSLGATDELVSWLTANRDWHAKGHRDFERFNHENLVYVAELQGRLLKVDDLLQLWEKTPALRRGSVARELRKVLEDDDIYGDIVHHHKFLVSPPHGGVRCACGERRGANNG